MKPGSIQISEGCLAQAPKFVAENRAALALREAENAQREFDAERDRRQAELDAKRQEAIAIQNRFDGMVAERGELLASIATAKTQLQGHLTGMQQIENAAAQKWNGQLADEIDDYLRRKFLTDRIPGYIKMWEARVSELTKEIADFASANGISEK